jgi:hypothetical protein
MITEALRSHLLNDAGVSALVTRIFPLTIPQGQDVPAIVYGMDSDLRDTLIDGETGSLKEALVDLDVYTTRYADSHAIAGAVEAALVGHTGVLGVLSPGQVVDQIRMERKFDLFETDTKFYRVSMQFFIAYY